MFKRLGDFIELALMDSDVALRLIAIMIVFAAMIGVLVDFDIEGVINLLKNIGE